MDELTEDEIADFFREIKKSDEEDLIIDFAEWYAIHYGHLISKTIINEYIEKKHEKI